MEIRMRRLVLLTLIISTWSCLSAKPAGIAPADDAETTVKFDYYADDLPEIPLPNDVATRYDETSPTGLRLNASKVVPSKFNERIRRLFGERDGWGLLQPITVPFTGPLDVESILEGHRDPYYEFDNDVIYLINIDPNSEERGRLHALDLGEGNYPLTLERIDNYWKNDPRGWTLSLLFEEEDEDKNGNGKLDRGEDTDADGVLDKPNYLPGHSPDRDDLAGRADALMTFYERETNTLIAKPLVPLREQTKYAVVVTKRLKDEDGNAVGSPFPYINHNSQTEALKDLPELLPDGTTIDDVAFAFSFTTQTVESEIIAVRDGLYGHGVQEHLADFEPVIEGLLPARDPDKFPEASNFYIVPGETWAQALELIQVQFNGGEPGFEFDAVMEAAQYVDYHVIGWYESPQLFPRKAENGDWLPFDEQSWPKDLTTTPAPTRSEKIYFHLTVPRKEVSARGDGEPAPVILFGHGYTSSRFDGVNFGPFFAKHGLASIGIDNVSHGLVAGGEDLSAATTLLNLFGLGPMADALLNKHRAFDHTYDGLPDSGADFWTAYMFHTRDAVRQSALDYMQLVRILRTFDGENEFDFDVNGDGENDIAGDFDGDGNVDIGGDAMIHMSGGSLGGMMSMVVGGIEPEITAIAPIVAGGGLGELGPRSQQSGVPEAFILRPLSPIVTGTLDEDDNLIVEQIVPFANDTPPEHHLGTVVNAEVGDTMVVYNDSNGERDCGYVSEEGTVRTSFEADKFDFIRVVVYEGDALVLGSTHCEVLEDAEERGSITEFANEIPYQGHVYKVGDPLMAMDEGLGMKRASPRFRRLTNLAQIVVDGADPSIYARHMLQDPLEYPGTGQKTETHVLMLTGTGDMSVPASGGIALGRSVGLIDYLNDNGKHDKSDNQVLIDTYMCEAVHNIKRYTDINGEGVHIDVDNFSEDNDRFAQLEVPRLDPPLRIGMDDEDPHGGMSAALFPYGRPEGQHGFGRPGEDKDRFLRGCEEACESEEDDCGCEDATAALFDSGNFFFTMAGLYLKDGGQKIRAEDCMSHGTCPDFPPPPEPRENPEP